VSNSDDRHIPAGKALHHQNGYPAGSGWLIDRLRFSDLPACMAGCWLLKSIQDFSRQQTADQEISQPSCSRQ
jgi:hypothetical protein